MGIQRQTGEVDVDDYVLYITDQEDNDSLIQLQNLPLDKVVQYAELIVENEDNRVTVTVFDNSNGDVLKTVHPNRDGE